MTTKSKGGSSCAVLTCAHYSSKSKQDGSKNISFHRFPKDPIKRKEWIQKCKRGNKWNPNTSYICSEHFTPDSFIRNMKAELLGYTPKVRTLKPNVVPTLNLPMDQNRVVSVSAINRKARMEVKLAKQEHEQLISSLISTPKQSIQSAATLTSNKASTASISKEDTVLVYDTSCNIKDDYKQFYNIILKKHDVLKIEHEKQETKLLSLKQLVVDYQKINENLRTKIKNLQNDLNLKNSLLIKTEKQMSKRIESEVEKLLSPKFSQNQINLLIKKKKKVKWSKDEMTKSLTLRRLSNRAYIYVKYVLLYPLPGLSSLQRWAKNNPKVVASVSNTIDKNQEYMGFKLLKLSNIKYTIDNNEHSNKTNCGNNTDTANKNQLQNKNEMADNEVKYLANWMTKKFKFMMFELDCTTTKYSNTEFVSDHDYTVPFNVNHLSCNELISPNSKCMKIILRVERLFNKFTKRRVPKGPNVISKLTDKIFSRMSISEKFKQMIQIYIKHRIIIQKKYITLCKYKSKKEYLKLNCKSK